MSVRINFEIGHEATIRTKHTADGFTHDWELFVRGCDNTDIHYFIEKVVFYLHNTFTNPKRVIKEPPYRVRESGYAGFTLPIDIYLRNNDEPKKIRFNYDLNLQPSGPTIHKVQKEKYVFSTPSEEFRHKLLKGGGTVLSSSNDSNRDISSSGDKQQSNKIKSSSSSDSSKKHRIKEHKQEFTDLFGTPIRKTSTISPDPKLQSSKSSPINNPVKSEKSSDPKKSKSKHSPKDKDRDKEKKDKSQEKKHKEEKKNKDRNKDKERKEKTKRDRSLSRSPKRSSSPKRPASPKRAPSPAPPAPPPPVKVKTDEKKVADEPIKEKTKSESKKSKHEQKDKDKEKKEHKSHKEKDKDATNRNVDQQKEHKSGSKEPKPPKDPTVYKNKEKTNKVPEEPIINKESKKIEKPPKQEIEKVEKVEKSEKPKHKHKKKDKEKKEKKEEKPKEKKSEKKGDKSDSFFERVYKEEAKESPKEVERPQINTKSIESVPEKKEKSQGLKALQAELLDDSSNSSLGSHDESSIEVPAKAPPPPPPPVVEKPPEPTKKSKEKTKSGGEQTSSEKKRKRKHESSVKEELPVKPAIEEPATKVTREEVDYPPTKAASETTAKTKNVAEEEITQDYMSILKDLQHKIMTLQDNQELQRVVQLIAETGHYEITPHTFDFDLCALDRDTVRRLQDFFTVS